MLMWKMTYLQQLGLHVTVIAVRQYNSEFLYIYLFHFRTQLSHTRLGFWAVSH